MVAPAYRVIGPRVVNNTVVLSDIVYEDIPAGFRDIQSAGSYRLENGNSREVFSFSPGPDSLKKYFHPSSEELFSFHKTAHEMKIKPNSVGDKPFAFIGIRACDIAALSLLDKVFLEGPVAEQGYSGRRKDIFIVAVNCLQPSENCFCGSMGTGPEATGGFDLSITELTGSMLVEAGSKKGEELLERLPHTEARAHDLDEKKELMSRCRAMMKKELRTGDLPGVIYRNLEHPRWKEIAERDLECGNCTMVCPTCFCSSTFDLLSAGSLSGKTGGFSGVRKRTWDSCFSKNFARVHGGNFRPSRPARYRQWMTHKLAYWIDQFGRPGCVGCGRCITWCPVGIDITHELEELRRVR